MYLIMCVKSSFCFSRITFSSCLIWDAIDAETNGQDNYTGLNTHPIKEYVGLCCFLIKKKKTFDDVFILSVILRNTSETDSASRVNISFNRIWVAYWL